MTKKNPLESRAAYELRMAKERLNKVRTYENAVEVQKAEGELEEYRRESLKIVTPVTEQFHAVS